MDIRDTILQKLGEIETRYGVRILHACESGSRAWKFVSPDSDYDVRFIYVRPAADYLRLDAPRDVIEDELNEVYDISGWDLRKYLQLLFRSNPAVFEWASSGIVYRTTEDWARLMPILPQYFSKKKILHHYTAMAKNHVRLYLSAEPVIRKKYLYVLRALLAAEWIHKYGSMSPLSFRLLASDALRGDELAAVEALLAAKESGKELQNGPRIPELDKLIAEKLAFLDELLPTLREGPKRPMDPINAYFLSELSFQSPCSSFERISQKPR